METKQHNQTTIQKEEIREPARQLTEEELQFLAMRDAAEQDAEEWAIKYGSDN
jgi:hypothetical protein